MASITKRPNGQWRARYRDAAASSSDAGAAHRAADLDPFGSDSLIVASGIEKADGDRRAALADARQAASREPHDWTTWVAVEQLAPTARERHAACQSARRENPRLAPCPAG